jgi:YVTN family beta-propeller protein
VGSDPTTNRIYTAHDVNNTVSVIDGATNTEIATVPVGSSPVAVAVNPTTNRIFTTNYLSNDVTIIDGATNTVIATVPVGIEPIASAVNPTTGLIYTANSISDSVSVFSDNLPPPPSACAIYPIALSAQSLVGVTPGTAINIANGSQPGNFGWLSWTGNRSASTLIASLTPPGNSSSYVNPNDPADHVLSPGDWVHSRPGIASSTGARAALTTLETQSIVVPVWNQARGSDNNVLYRVASFAQVRIIGYQLSSQNRISATFQGLVTCRGTPQGVGSASTRHLDWVSDR